VFKSNSTEAATTGGDPTKPQLPRRADSQLSGRVHCRRAAKGDPMANGFGVVSTAEEMVRGVGLLYLYVQNRLVQFQYGCWPITR